MALSAIESNVQALQSCSEELKEDLDVQEAALASERRALLEAVKIDGYALRSASKRLQAERAPGRKQVESRIEILDLGCRCILYMYTYIYMLYGSVYMKSTGF